MTQNLKTGTQRRVLHSKTSNTDGLFRTSRLEPTVIQVGHLRVQRNAGCLTSAALLWLVGKDQSKKWVIQRMRGASKGIFPTENECLPISLSPSKLPSLQQLEHNWKVDDGGHVTGDDGFRFSFSLLMEFFFFMYFRSPYHTSNKHVFLWEAPGTWRWVDTSLATILCFVAFCHHITIWSSCQIS